MRCVPIRLLVLTALLALLASAAALIAAGAAGALPAGSVTEFPFSSHEESEPLLIAPGPDGNVWFSIHGNKAAYSAIGRISPSGTVLSEFSEGLHSIPLGLTAGPDGNVWFAAAGPDAIGRASVGGSIGEFTAGLESHEPERIVLGPDGNLWFNIESSPTFNSLGWATPAGEINVIPPSALMAGSHPQGVTGGPEGDIWFADGGGSTGAIGRLAPCGHCTPKVEEFTVGLPPKSAPESIATGADGNLWFTDEATGAIGRVVPCAAPCTPSIEEFPLGPGRQPFDIATGADGKLWFTDAGSNELGQVTPCTPAPGCTPTIGESAAGLATGAALLGIAAGPDGNMWFTDRGTSKAIGRIGTGAPAALQAPPAIVGGGIAGSPQTCAAASWSTWGGEQPSASAFGFDGYGWQLDGVDVASGQTYTPTSAQLGRALTCSERVSYPLPLLVTPGAATSSPVTVAAAPSVLTSPPALLALRPRLTSLRQSATRWREGRKLARISRRVPVGTTFTFALSEPASVRLAFVQPVHGRRVGRRCVAKTRRNARRRACTRTLGGTLVLSAHAGVNRVVFQGRLSARKALPLGGYTMTITAVNRSGLRSAPASLRFTIVR